MTKIYEKPEIKVTEFQTEDILQTSGMMSPTTKIDGVEATDLGSKSFSIFDE